MSRKPLVLRAVAEEDVDLVVAAYLIEASEEVAMGFVEALNLAFDHIRQMPASGSPRYAHELAIPGLRCWQLKRYPYLVLYRERTSEIDVIRVIHARRSIPDAMAADDQGR